MFPRDTKAGHGGLFLPAFRTTRSLFFALLMTWTVLCGVSFLVGAVSHFADPPGDVQLPWSDFSDFVEGADGNVYVHLSKYSRVLCYSRAGYFIASYPTQAVGAGPPTGAREPTSARPQNSGRARQTPWSKLSDEAEADCASRAGVKGHGDGAPCLPDSGPAVLAAGGVRPPAASAVDESAPRTQLSSPDGTLLERRGGSLLRLSKEGEVLTRYNTPWYLAWGTLPWSVWLGCVILFFTLLNLSESAREAKKIACP